MNCPACGFENPEESRFCGECGEALATTLTCPACGAEVPRGFKFCNGCGQPLGDQPSPALPERDPRSYTPKHLADKILHGKSALEGERKQVTVLFADVKGSMDLAEQVDPEEWHRILNRFFEILTDGVHRFEGTVNQYTGDGIMALFGAPIAHEDHAQRACYAALYLRDELRGYADEIRRRGLDFAVRMGLNSGEVVVGKIGDDLRMDYTAQGQVVNLAQRVEQVAAADSAYLTEDTARLVEGFFELRELGEFELKGIASAVPVYALEGIGPIRTRLDLARARGFSRFVGRGDEMDTLELALRHAQEGNGRVVSIVGDAGVGKSRLCHEFLEGCRERGLIISRGCGISHGKSIPLHPVLMAYRDALGIGENDSDQQARERIAGRYLLLDPGFAQDLPLLFEFLGVPDPDRPAPSMDPEALTRRFQELTRRYLHARSDRGETAVLLMEDLHWFDAASEAWLPALVQAATETRTLLVTNYRPEFRPPWRDLPGTVEITLEPLGAEDTAELLQELLGVDASLDALKREIEERTEGNPFFVEEVVQSLADSGQLQGTRGRYRLATPVERIKIPHTVQAVLAARIDRLPEQEKRLLQTAAVIGKEFSEPILAEVAELPEAYLAASLAALQDARFIHERALYPIAEYAFNHPLIQEGALGSQLQSRRRSTHAGVARAIESAHPFDAQAALLAHHWEEANEALEAGRWHSRAARWIGRKNQTEARRHWSAVRVLLARVEPAPEVIELAVEARAHLILLGERSGASDQELDELLAEARNLSGESDNVHALAFALSHYAYAKTLSGHLAAAMDPLEDATRLADRLGDRTLKLVVTTTRANILYIGGSLEQALTVNEEGIELSGGDAGMGSDVLGTSPYLLLLAHQALVLTAMGHPTRADQSLKMLYRLARQRSDPIASVMLHSGEAFRAELTGECQRALGLVSESMAVTRDLKFSNLATLRDLHVGITYLAAERWDEAASALERGLQRMQHRRLGQVNQPRVLACLARVYRVRGEAARAEEAAREAVRLSRASGARWYRADACIALAEVLIAVTGVDARAQIESTLAEAQHLIDETGARGFQPLVHRARADLARLLGDHASHQRELREAHRLYVEMGATRHAEGIAEEFGP